MTYFTGRVAVVTGAASGIGRALAIELARRGARLAICDVDGDGLARTQTLVADAGAEVRADELDVSDREAMLRYADEIAAHFGVVHLVINNAGLTFVGDISEMEFADLERVMAVDYWGVVNGTKAFLPHLLASADGHVVNVSSVFGLIAVPMQGAYNAAKFAVRGFTETLRAEMLLRGGAVAVTAVHPGGIKTNIARNAGRSDGRDRDSIARTFDRIAHTSPERAAEVILRGVQKRKARVLIGPDAVAIDIVSRVLGPHYQRLAALAARRSGL